MVARLGWKAPRAARSSIATNSPSSNIPKPTISGLTVEGVLSLWVSLGLNNKGHGPDARVNRSLRV